MNEPLVSVHMITYNHEPFIRQAIESVIAQKTNFAFELVIGEDHSTDGTRDVVFEYVNRYPEVIRLVTSEKNVGAMKNAHRTTEACRGKYLAFCEGDDFWHHPQKLQKQVDFLENHPEYGLVYSDHDRVFSGFNKKIERFYRTTNNLPPEPLNVFRGWGPYHILTCTVMVQKSLVESITADSNLYSNEQKIGGMDIPLFIEVSMVSKIHYIDESLATYRVQSESASNISNFGKKAHFVKCNIESFIYLAEKYNIESEKVYFQHLWDRICLWIAFLEKDSQLARHIKKHGKSFSLKSWILYKGAVNGMLRSFLFPFFKVLLKKRNKPDYELEQFFTNL